jgi:hypothetical protein
MHKPPNLMNGKECHVGYNIMEYTLSNLVKNTFKSGNHLNTIFKKKLYIVVTDRIESRWCEHCRIYH